MLPMNILARYTKWLHTMWPAGGVEKGPVVNDDGSCNVPGVRIVGDLTGVPLFKFSLDTGARAIQSIIAESSFQKGKGDGHDIVIIGGGVSGMSAAVEAKKQGLDFVILEASQPFSTVANFPKRKPIFTYPTDMEPTGDLKVTGKFKEDVLEELDRQKREFGIEPVHKHVSHFERKGDGLEVVIGKGDERIKTQRVVVAIGRSGNYRKLGVPGEEKDKVSNRLHDPAEFDGKHVMVVGGGDSALEGAISLAESGAQVTLSYRKPEFSRPKPENAEKIKALSEAGKIDLQMPSNVKEIRDDEVTLINSESKEETTVKNDYVFAMIGREPPLDFFRRSGINITGEGTPMGGVWLAVFLIFCVFVYTWKGKAPTETWLNPWPGNMPDLIAGLGAWFEAQVNDRSTIIGTLAVSMQGRSFYYTALYAGAVVFFGIGRIRRRKTPYVTLQTSVLMAIQVIPLFLLPELLLPWMGYNGVFDSGFGLTVANGLFEPYISEADLAAGIFAEGSHPRAYWRAYGFILAWPLMIYNIFTSNPMWWWITIGFTQTFVLIPTMIYFWGKGAYCGWICSCGALAETMGDQQRHKMPHGMFWNKLNMAGQVILWIAFILLGVRIIGWVLPEGNAFASAFDFALYGTNAEGKIVFPLSYNIFVDVFLAGIIGVGFYFKYSGRVWCRFFCPLAALMHIYAKFSRFGIVADKKKCISCNVCTSVCHQGIDIMSFANKGKPMQDVECVRCSACVQSCPTGVLTFGQVDKDGNTLSTDSLPASLVQMAEANQNK